MLSRLGSYSLDSIIAADAIEVLSQLPTGCIDLIVTDPPYGIGYRTNRGTSTPGKRICATEILGDTVENIMPMVEPVCRVLKEGGAMYWFTRWDVFPIWRKEIAKYLTVKTPLVWDKGNWSMGNLKGDYGNRVELIIYAVKGRHILRGGRDHNLLSFTRPVDSGEYRLHPHQKPQKLLEFLIRKSSDEGDLVADFFCGSGSTLIAAKQLGRKWLGVDIAEKYAKLSRTRIAYTQPPLLVT